MSRPLIQLGVGSLEALFAKSKVDVDVDVDVEVLKQLEHELQYRQVPRAVALLAEVQAAMPRAQSVATAKTPPNPAPASAPKQPSLWERPVTPAAPPPPGRARQSTCSNAHTQDAASSSALDDPR